MIIVLTRHAEPVSEIWEGPDAERPLTDRGNTQADALANRLIGVPFTAIMASPALRCRETAQRVAALHDGQFQVRPELDANRATSDPAGLIAALEKVFLNSVRTTLFSS